MADTKTDSTKTDSKAGAPGGVDVNEEIVATHPGFVAASDEPHPNPHIAGQTPAGETDQPTAGPTDDLQRVLGEAERAVSAHLVYENGVPSTRPEHLDPIEAALEAALKQVRSAKKA
jgi:hypothetical protein